MQKRSHLLLSSPLLHRHSGLDARRHKWAFLFGSVQPDCNPLSYLKGSCRARALRGHNFSNSRHYIYRRIRRLQQRSRWTLWQYYTLGKLTHYLADAFTWPHNEHCPLGLRDHRRYEAQLRQYLSGQKPVWTVTRAPADLTGAIDELHRQYVSCASDIRQDACYALRALELLMAGCRPASF